MATRSAIGIRMDDGKIFSCYCHWDGYPSGVGAVLSQYYKTEEKIKSLISLGDMSSLGCDLSLIHI